MVGTVLESRDRRRRLSAAALAALVVAGSAGAAAAASRPRVEGLTAVREAARLVVSFRIAGAPLEEDLERLRSGLPVSYRHRVELVARRTMWPAKVLSRGTVTSTAVYNSLVRRYSLERIVKIGGRSGPDELTQREETDSAEAVRAWLTEVQALELPGPPDTVDPERLRVKVETAMSRRYVLLLFPSRISVSAECLPTEPE